MSPLYCSILLGLITIATTTTALTTSKKDVILQNADAPLIDPINKPSDESLIQIALQAPLNDESNLQATAHDNISERKVRTIGFKLYGGGGGGGYGGGHHHHYHHVYPHHGFDHHHAPHYHHNHGHHHYGYEHGYGHHGYGHGHGHDYGHGYGHGYFH